jgi:UDP-N-acetylglucosamine 2-epimerase (non-hydrolysing)
MTFIRPQTHDASRVMAIFGTRPEAIKMAPLILLLKAEADFVPRTVVTGQHRSMLDQVLDLFGIVPDHDLGIGQDRQTLAGVTQRALAGLDELIGLEKPDLVVVQGDTTTTFAGALAAFYHRVPVAHMEAGLRTGNAYSPYPEEINRRLTTQLTALHLAPTPTSAANLKSENVDSAAILCTGNTVIDALLEALQRPLGPDATFLNELCEGNRRVLLVTAHRRESWGAPMQAIGRALARIAHAEPTLQIVFPIHLNPVVREAIQPAVAGLPNVRLIDPLAYGTFCHLMNRADLVLTDSGGVQEEAPALGKPVLVLRDSTERPEAVLAGTVRLVGTDEDRILHEVRRLLHDRIAYQQMARAVNPYGDGRAAPRTIAAIRHFLGEGERPEEFAPDLLLASPPEEEHQQPALHPGHNEPSRGQPDATTRKNQP